jgi:hypothetical protein
MLTRRGIVAVKVVKRMHIFADYLLDAADFIEMRIKTSYED